MRKNFRNIFLVGFFILPLFIIPAVVLGQGTSVIGGGGNTSVIGGSSGCSGVSGNGIPNPLKGGCDLYKLIELVVNDVVLPIGGVLAVFFTIYSGFLMVTAGGNEEKLKSAKMTLLYTLIGSAVLLGSWVIAKAISNTIDQIKSPSSYVYPETKDKLAQSTISKIEF